ncbi:MAG: hypothetical protein HBSIN02_21960 [Bacteroidia bacterium]|nr:MAG: hypothetical protein HBSIN02_21960 [Bacteroidia bacterium]
MAKRIFVIWASVVLFFLGLYAIVDHGEINRLSVVVNGLLLLLGIVALAVFLKEPSKKNKPVFLNFAIFFLLSIAGLIYPLIGHSLFTNSQFAPLYFYQYVSSGLVVFFLGLSIVYVAIDTLFNDLSMARKYIIAIAIVGSVASYYYHPYLSDPKYLYKTQDITDFKIVDDAVRGLQAEGVADPTPEQIGARVTLNVWRNGEPVGVLFPDQNVERIAFLLPYLQGANYALLLLKPIHLNIIYLEVLAIAFIFVFFGYQYKNDPPQGAYIEKIVFLFLPYCSLEILHFFSYVTSNDYATYQQLYSIAQYLVIFNLLNLLIFFSLRLSFITSIKGEFYERELVLDSEHISRWRDNIDSLVVRHFLNPKTIHGRLFAPREAKSKA